MTADSCRPANGKAITYGSLFTGIAGFDLGFDRAGLQGQWQVEKDKDCNRVLSRHYAGTQRGCLVEEVTPERFGRVDVICGGFPCQDLSVAGKRKGLAGERSGLWHEFHRIIAEFKPSGFVIENVPGLFSSHGGRDLLTILRGLAELRYCLAWAVLDSQYRGVPQRRDRVFIVGSLGNGSCAEILFEPESVRGDSPPSREAGERIAGTIGGSSQSGGFRTTDLDNSGAFIPMTVGALTDGAHSGGGLTDRTLTAVEFLPSIAGALQERDAKGTDSDTKPGHLIVMRQGGSFDEAIAHTLSAEGADASEDGTGRGTPLVAVGVRNSGRGFWKEDDSAAALGTQARGIHESTLVASGGVTIAHRTTGNCGIQTQGDKIGALNTATDPCQNILQQGMMVRRLTPRECERLQGFPDDWTRWDADGKEISDSARYRMLGNAVTATVAEWIGGQVREKLVLNELSC